MEEALGEETTDAQGRNGSGEGGRGRCRGLFELEADDVSFQQVRVEIYLRYAYDAYHIFSLELHGLKNAS